MGDGVREIVQAQLASAEKKESGGQLGVSELAGAPVVGGGGGEIGVADMVGVKRRRGRPPRNPAAVAAVAAVRAVPVAKRITMEEEDVCFLCFDGGTLVLCDKRDCPKAYHPACVKRGESFFEGNVRWTCGWHICNTCERNALFMCYTCPNSFCKGCVSEAEIFCVRGNKGFCKTCMTTIMLIENVPQGNNETAQVDFDDKTSWEYLFKVYWVLLKEKESLTIDELTRATNPWKGSRLDHKDDETYEMSVNRVPFRRSRAQQSVESASKRRKMRKQPQGPQLQNTQLLNKDLPVLEETDGGKGLSSSGGADWASKELLEFVAHMKNGDMSLLSQFDVQALLLEYIKQNNLCDPRQTCQIICDRRLEKLFSRSRVGHFEMLKLLENHFKESTHLSETQSRERNWPIRGDDKGQESNRDNYAAIDLHNINLIYLTRDLIENLIDDAEKFHDKIFGSFVRIRVSCNDQKQDMYRLVRVIGTSKMAEPYKIGHKTANIMLKILNLNKIEDIAVNALSNQEFSEDECKRLRQSIKLGLVERMTLGEIQEKAAALQLVRADNSLEAEILKLCHLRDRATEMGQWKELKEYVEKIEALKVHAERQRSLREIPEVHADPKMDPSYDSEEDSEESNVQKQDGHMTQNNLAAKSNELDSSRRNEIENKPGAKVARSSAPTQARKRNISGKVQSRNRMYSSAGTRNRGIKTSGSFHHAASNDSETSVVSSDFGEHDMIWHYQDPKGKIHGPFRMLHLRKWNSEGFFPNDLRVWRKTETQDQSVLLTDVLTGQFHSKDDIVSESREASSVGESSRNVDRTWLDHKPNAESFTPQSENNDVKWHNIENNNKHSFASNVQTQEPSLSQSNLPGAFDVSNLSNDVPKSEEKHPVAPNLQDHGSMWSSLFGEDVPSNVPVPDTSAFKDQGVENKNPATTVAPVQDSIFELAGEGGGFLNLLQGKPSALELDPDLVSGSSLKQTEVFSNHATPDSGQLTHSSLNHTECDTSSLQPIELCALDDESLSDLLGEVEAMDCLRGATSPGSRMDWGDHTIDLDSPGDDGFDLFSGLSLRLNHGKNDAFSSTGDVHFHSELSVRDQPHGVSFGHVHDLPKTSNSYSTESSEAGRVNPIGCFSVHQNGLVSDAAQSVSSLQPTASSLYSTNSHDGRELKQSYISFYATHTQEQVPRSHQPPLQTKLMNIIGTVQDNANQPSPQQMSSTTSLSSSASPAEEGELKPTYTCIQR